jgi:hypothetical protein
MSEPLDRTVSVASKDETWAVRGDYSDRPAMGRRWGISADKPEQESLVQRWGRIGIDRIARRTSFGILVGYF